MSTPRCVVNTVLLLSWIFLYAIASGQERHPIIEFPTSGVDDTVAYRGYQTRFFRDSKGNTVQVVINRITGRVVSLWADGADESISFTARYSDGRPAQLSWSPSGAEPSSDKKMRYLQFEVATDSPSIDIGLFLLASMRKERDIQYLQKELLPFDTDLSEEESLVRLTDNLGLLDVAERERQLALLSARNVEELRLRLRPVVGLSKEGRRWVINVRQPTFDGRNLLSLRISDDTTSSRVQESVNALSIHSATFRPVKLTVRIGTDSPALTPLTGRQIFNDQFLGYYGRIIAQRDSLRRRRVSGSLTPADRKYLHFADLVERQVRSIELLCFKEKLMAGLPNYATYFGRDMMMSAMMMESILRPSTLEHVIESVLRKLSPAGEVSHEEALGGQAIRESAAEYNSLIAGYFRHQQQGDTAEASRLLIQARMVLSAMQRVREDFKMVDETLQLPVLVAQYLISREVTNRQKKAFLFGKIEGTSHLALIMKNLLFVYEQAAPFAERQDATALVSFHRGDRGRWQSGSWRDSGAGYGNGRFAMDVNAIWVPQALKGSRTILSFLRSVGISNAEIDRLLPETKTPPFRGYLEDVSQLDGLIKKWEGVWKLFTVTFTPEEIRKRGKARLSLLPGAEQAYWNGILAKDGTGNAGFTFAALSLDSAGTPIPVVNSDPATGLFLEDYTGDILSSKVTSSDVWTLVDPFITPYPVGLYVQDLGPLVANDAYASKDVWESFQRDEYHSPRVVWGREVNLFMLGVCRQIRAARGTRGQAVDPRLVSYVGHLQAALEKIHGAVEASEMKQSELWSYSISDGRLLPARYAASCDIQLWNMTDLAVQYELSRLPK